MPSSAVSPDNYIIGKGKVYFKPEGETDFRDLGNAPEVEFTPELEELEHNSSREGVRVRDRTVIIEKSAEIRLVLEEFTLENLALAMIGDIDDSGGDPVLNIFSQNAIRGELRIWMTNEIGPRFDVEFPAVSFQPSGSLGFITDEWGQMELTGNVEISNGTFGTMTPIDSEAPAEPDFGGTT